MNMTKHLKPNDHRSIPVVDFLDAYQKQENLWNSALESYKNKCKREEAYKNIIRELNLPNLTVNDIKLKVKSVRTTYTKELRLLTKYKEQGSSYQPKLFWFQRAHVFLKPVSMSREKRQSGKSNQPDEFAACVTELMNEDVDTDDLDERCITSPSYDLKSVDPSIVVETTHLTSATSEMEKTKEENPGDEQLTLPEQPVSPATKEAAKKPSNCNVITNADAPVDNSKTASKTEVSSSKASDSPKLNGSSSANLDDEYDLFCRSVCAQLRQIPDNYSRSVAKLKIQQILFQAETGHYRNHSNLSLSSSSQHLNIIE